MEKSKTPSLTRSIFAFAISGLSVSVLAQEVISSDEVTVLPYNERVAVSMDPLHFEGVDPADENENHRLWNELIKYKLWGTDSVVFNKGGFKITDPSGYTGTALGRVYFRNGEHTLGGPIISGNDIEISYPRMGADKDSLLGGPVHAGWLVLPNWYQASETYYNSVFCFEKHVYMENGRTTDVVNRFLDNVHNAGGKVYADWDKDYTDPDLGDFTGLPGLHLDGSYAACPENVPMPERNLTVPVLKEITSWDAAIDMTSSSDEEVQFIHVPPITASDAENQHVWFDKYVEDIRIGGSTGKKLYVLMPSAKHNVNGETGRLTRVFSKDGINIQKIASDTKIQVAYVNDSATWNTMTKTWDDLDINRITVVPDSSYAGNLLFYTNADITWPSMTDADFQGTFITTGVFTIYDHINVAGQLIGGKGLKFESDFNGRFHYVPFNPPRIVADKFVEDIFTENNSSWQEIPFNLTDTALTDVSFDYCYSFMDEIENADVTYKEYKGEGGEFAKIEDLNTADSEHEMPLCKNGESRHIIINRGQTKPTKPEFSAYIKVADDRLIEGDEYMLIRIMNLSGAAISGQAIEGAFLVKLLDAPNNPPTFTDLVNMIFIVNENATKATVGQVYASDADGDSLVFTITGGTVADRFQIDAVTGIVSMKDSAAAFDYELWKSKKEEYTLELQVCDARATEWVPSLCDERKMFTVNVEDMNEKPYFIFEDEDKKVITFAKKQRVSQDTVKFEDTDKYDTNGWLAENEIVIVGGDSALFEIAPNGVVRIKDSVSIDSEKDKEYTLVLQVRDSTKDDSGELNYPDLYDEATFTVVVKASKNITKKTGIEISLPTIERNRTYRIFTTTGNFLGNVDLGLTGGIAKAPALLKQKGYANGVYLLCGAKSTQMLRVMVK